MQCDKEQSYKSTEIDDQVIPLIVYYLGTADKLIRKEQSQNGEECHSGSADGCWEFKGFNNISTVQTPNSTLNVHALMVSCVNNLDPGSKKNFTLLYN